MRHSGKMCRRIAAMQNPGVTAAASGRPTPFWTAAAENPSACADQFTAESWQLDGCCRERIHPFRRKLPGCAGMHKCIPYGYGICAEKGTAHRPSPTLRTKNPCGNSPQGFLLYEFFNKTASYRFIRPLSMRPAALAAKKRSQYISYRHPAVCHEHGTIKRVNRFIKK